MLYGNYQRDTYFKLQSDANIASHCTSGDGRCLLVRHGADLPPARVEPLMVASPSVMALKLAEKVVISTRHQDAKRFLHQKS